MLGDVFDWDATIHFISFVRFIMGLKNSKTKKGGVPPPGSADPPCKLEEEADVQRVTTEPVSESINSASPPSTPRSPVSDTSPESLSKDCETPSTAEEVSFASCLTDSPNSLSENPAGTAVKTQPLVNSVLKGVIKNPEASLNSDSEYESAEEVDLPPDPTVVTQQPSSENCLPAPPVTDCTQSPEQAVTPSSDKSASETETQLENSIVENSINGNCVNVENGFVDGAEDLSEQHLASVDTKDSAISESLVTVTRNEVIEETISTKTCVEQEVTEVISSHTVINEQVSSLTEGKEELPLESQGPVDIKNECNGLPVGTEVQQEESARCVTNEVEKAQPTNEEVESVVQNCVEKTENSAPVKEELLNREGNEETEPVNHCESQDITFVEKQVEEEILKDSQPLQTTQVESKDNQSILNTSESSEVDNVQPPTGNKVPCDSPPEQVTEEPADSALGGDDLPIPPKKGYCLDFLDNLDDPNFNPFATKTAVRNTPPPSPEAGRKLPPLKPAIRKKKDTKNSVKDPEPSANTGDNTQNLENTSESKGEDTPSVESKPSDHPNSDQLLEVTPEDSSKSPSKPPPRRNCKSVPSKKPVSKAPKSKVIEKNNNRVNEKALNETENKTEPEEELPVPPSKGYNLDFLDNLDDLNFNPFATKCTVSNSPPKDGVSVPNDHEPKPKAKVVSPKKTVPKKGFSVIKNKVKVQPGKQEHDIKPDTTPSSEENKVAEETPNSEEVEDLPVQPKKGYNLDFLDDPNFDPFKTKSCVNEISNSTAVETSKPTREVLGGPCTEEPKTLSKETSEDTSQQSVNSIPVEQEEHGTLSINHVSSECADVTDSPKESKEICNSFEGSTVQEEENCRSSESSVAVNGVLEADKVEVLEKTDKETNSHLGENKSEENEINELKVESKGEGKQGKDFCLLPDESESFYEGNLGLPKVPSIGTIGHLDSLEFAQLLGNEASRLAEEFMNCSTDSGLPDSDDSVHVKSVNLNSNMADKDISTLARLSAHLDENINPFQKNSKLQRSPPLGRRDVCGAEGGDGSETFDPFKPRRALLRESGTGEERLDTYSLDDDSGIALGTRSDLETDVNHSEAGPEIATGLTSSDLQCASQFFKEATDIENQLRKSLATPLRGSQSKLSGNEVTPTKDKSELSSSSTPDHQSKPVPSTSTPVPPHEERSAPEGTSSPTPRPSDTSEHKPSSSRPNSIPPEGYMSTAEVQKLLKQQELQFEEKLLRAELVSGEKEKKLRQAMKDEQKEMSNLGETVTELTQSRDALLKLVGQYKGMLASLVSEKEKEKQNQEERIKTLEQERNQALEDLANVEVAFSDVHRKYERTKQVVDTLRRNEETLRGAVTDYENKLQKQEQKFIEFQKHAEEKIQLANEEFEAMRRANDQEMTKMAALLKKAEMKIMSLQDSNDRKTRENQELTQLCDDLINKVGTSH